MNPAPSILVVAPNWLGDVLMALPAVQSAIAARPDAHWTLLTRPAFAPLWAMALPPPPQASILTHPKTAPLRPLLRRLAAESFTTAYILPHSFRSAWPPYLARIPDRIGLPGHLFRDLLLTQTRPPRRTPDRAHQAYEILDLFQIPTPDNRIPPPRLHLPADARETAMARLNSFPKPWISILPGAARGPSKQWPAESYSRLLQLLSEQTPATFFLLGTPAEAPLCQTIAAAPPSSRRAQNLAGTTTLEQMTAILALSDAVVCNDSGGMHLAAALGTPLVALFGITDPAQTGPLGSAPIHILQHSTLRTRDLPRRSPVAEAALRSIPPEEALAALLPLLPR